ncbi:RtcB family protein [Bacteroidota bacterium]
MKKVRISGKELRRLGFPNEVSISLAKIIISKYYKRSTKIEVLGILQDIIQNQDKYKKHDHFSRLIEALNPTYKQQTSEIIVEPNPLPYKIYGKKEIEEGSIKQMDNAMRLPITAEGALMADAHLGYGLPIGGVVATKNAVIPYGVGMDIGCRMCMSVYDIPVNIIEKDKSRLKNILLDETRFGNDEFNNPADHRVLDRKEFKEIPFLKSLHTKAYKQIGTSGHGNHFIDIGVLEINDVDNEFKLAIGKYFAVLTHSGSRGMGAEIARHYTRIAKDICQLPKGFTELSWLYLDKEEGQEYWLAMNLAGDYSAANHEQIHQRFSKALAKDSLFKVENHHNFAWKEKFDDSSELIIHRKGATPASKGVLGIIPGSMASSAYLVRGKGNRESLNSAAHGAGRILSRKAAKASISKKEMRQFLSKNKITLFGGNTDEAPWVYKDIDKVMYYQKDLVEVIAKFTPRIVRMAK